MKRLTWMPLILIFVICNSSTCKHTHNNNPPAPRPINMDKEWTLEASPNGIDNVGVVFAIDSNGTVTRIPGGALDLATITRPIAITQQTKTKSVSAGALINFLAIKNIDSTANVFFRDTIRNNATFQIGGGTITVIGNDTIKAKFETRRKVIEDNIRSLHLENANLFLILETIKSTNINITLDKSSQVAAGFAAKIKKMLGVGGDFKIDKSNNADLIYEGKDSLTVFYKLNSINVISSPRGNGPPEISVSLGDVLDSDELKFR